MNYIPCYSSITDTSINILKHNYERRSFTFRIKYIIMITFILVVMLFVFTLLFTKSVSAEPETNYYKKVVSVEIKEGDTLWSIASDYYSEACGDLREYIKEIKETNNLDSDTIHYNNYLLVPYYLYAE